MLSDEQRKLVKDNMNLVFYCIHKHHLKLEDQDIGFIGLCKAAKNYDPSLGIKFSTYAISVIMSQFLILIRHEINFKGRTLNEAISLDTKISTQDDNLCLEDMIEQPSTPSTTIEGKMFIKNYLEYIASLKSPRKEMLYYFYLGFNQHEIKELTKINYSQSYISRIISTENKKFIHKYYKDMSFEDIRKELYGERY